MRVIICDDDNYFLRKMEQEIKEYFQKEQIRADIEICSNGGELLQLCAKGNVDAVFLDIDMPGQDGFRTAKQMKEKVPECIVVFCSNHNELVYDSFEYEPFWFLCKGDCERRLKSVLEKAVRQIRQNHRAFTVETKEGLMQVRYKEVLYFAIANHKIQIHKENKLLEYRGKLTDVEKQLTGLDFVKINSGCIVNLDWIYKMKDSELILKNKEVLAVSRSNKQKVKELFFGYLERR